MLLFAYFVYLAAFCQLLLNKYCIVFYYEFHCWNYSKCWYAEITNVPQFAFVLLFWQRENLQLLWQCWFWIRKGIWLVKKYHPIQWS